MEYQGTDLQKSQLKNAADKLLNATTSAEHEEVIAGYEKGVLAADERDKNRLEQPAINEPAFQEKMAASIEKAISMAHEKFGSTTANSDFVTALSGMAAIENLMSNPNMVTMQREAEQAVINSANNPHWLSMTQEAMQAISGSMNNPYMAEMQAAAAQAASSILSNPYLEEMQQVARQSVIDSANNPQMEAMKEEVRKLFSDTFKGDTTGNDLEMAALASTSKPGKKEEGIRDKLLSTVLQGSAQASSSNNPVRECPERLKAGYDAEWIPLSDDEKNMVTGLSMALRAWRHQQAINNKNIDLNKVFSISETSCHRYQNSSENDILINFSPMYKSFKEAMLPQEVDINNLFGGFSIDGSSIINHGKRLIKSENSEENNRKTDRVLGECIIIECRDKKLCSLKNDDLYILRLAGESSNKSVDFNNKIDFWENYWNSILVGSIGSVKKPFLDEKISQALIDRKSLIRSEKESEEPGLSCIVENLIQSVNGNGDNSVASGNGASVPSYKIDKQDNLIDINPSSDQFPTPYKK